MNKFNNQQGITSSYYYNNSYFQQRDNPQNMINRQYMGISKNKTVLFNQAKQFYKKQKNVNINGSVHHTTLNLPPRYFDNFEFAKRDLSDIQLQIDEIVQLINDRITIQFSKTDQLKEQRVKTKQDNVMHMIKGFETKLNQIVSDNSEDTGQIDVKIRRNMRISLTSQLQDSTLVLRDAQKRYQEFMQINNKQNNFNKMNVVDPFQFQNQSNHNLLGQQQQNQQFSNSYERDYQLQREQRINAVAESIKQLTIIFGQMNEIVIQNGTILDRIDSNLEKVEVNIKKGTQQIRKANNNSLKGNFAQKCICTLIMLNAIVMCILILKLTVF
ncbi:hypothetical protein ABPG74_001401 [Tetrahymena malaccensis]